MVRPSPRPHASLGPLQASPAGPSGASRLLERTRELSRRHDCATGAAQTGRGRLALVCGEAGIGTALLRQFHTSLPPYFTVLWGTCDPLFALARRPDPGVVTPLGPFYGAGSVTHPVTETCHFRDRCTPLISESAKEVSHAWNTDAWGSIHRDLRAAYSVDRMFDEWLGGGARACMPAIDIVREDGHLVVRADLPGVKPEKVKIEVENTILTVSGEQLERKEEKDKRYVRRERGHGSFSPAPHGGRDRGGQDHPDRRLNPAYGAWVGRPGSGRPLALAPHVGSGRGVEARTSDRV